MNKTKITVYNLDNQLPFTIVFQSEETQHNLNKGMHALKYI